MVFTTLGKVWFPLVTTTTHTSIQKSTSYWVIDVDVKVSTNWNGCLSETTLMVSTLTSLPDTPLKTGKYKKKFKTFSHGVKMNNLKGTWWCSPNSLQKFYVSDLASLRLRLDLQIPSITIPLRRCLGKRRAWSLDFTMVCRILNLMLVLFLVLHRGAHRLISYHSKFNVVHSF